MRVMQPVDSSLSSGRGTIIIEGGHVEFEQRPLCLQQTSRTIRNSIGVQARNETEP